MEIEIHGYLEKSIENSWKSTDILRKVQQVFKMAENAEKPGFTVFCLFTPLFRCFRLPRVPQREELFELYRLISKILHFMPSGSVSKIWNPRTYYENFNRCSKWLKMQKNNVLRFLPFYPLISVFQASSRTPAGRTFRDLSIGIGSSSFHAFWLGIENWESTDIL